MRTRVVAVAAALVLIAVVAVVNSHRVHHAPRAVPAPAPAPVVITQPLADCPSDALSKVDVEYSATAVDSYHNKTFRVQSLRCDTGQGNRNPSQVQVQASDAADNQVLAVLIKLGQTAHFYSLDAQGSTNTVSGVQIGATFTVNYTDWDPRHELGAMFSQAFTTTDGVNFRPGTPSLEAPACGLANLRLTVAAASGKSAATVLRVVNVSDTPCAIEGYPIVSAMTAAPVESSVPITARSELRGASGGVMTGNAPPVILLVPGGAASAALDSSDQASDGGATLCESLSSVTVGLVSGASLGSTTVKMRVCDFQTHPWVPGLTGSQP